MLTVEANVKHPCVGSGIFYKLELPFVLPVEETVRLTLKMNEAEVRRLDGPPHLGAWTKHIRFRRIAYVGFWPNIVFEKGITTHLVSWMVERGRWANRLVEQILD